MASVIFNTVSKTKTDFLKADSHSCGKEILLRHADNLKSNLDHLMFRSANPCRLNGLIRPRQANTDAHRS